jgi:hypothetical protein
MTISKTLPGIPVPVSKISPREFGVPATAIVTGIRVAVGECVAVAVGLGRGVAVNVAVAVAVEVGCGVFVDVAVLVAVAVFVAVFVAVDVGVLVAVAVGVGVKVAGTTTTYDAKRAIISAPLGSIVRQPI